MSSSSTLSTLAWTPKGFFSTLAMAFALGMLVGVFG